jgi:glycosyltransferase involved in cell wall biosynthesis
MKRIGFNADRLVNRFITYPSHLRTIRNEFDCFHIVDHSYAQLVRALPAERTGVFCHDLDAFRCLIEPKQDPRPWWFRRLARRILSGLRKAALVFHSTQAVRCEMEAYSLVDPSRLVHAPYGVAVEFTADGPSDQTHAPFILHVGSNIPRKRIDVLLKTFSGLRRRFVDLKLVKVGGEFTKQQQNLIRELGLREFIVHREGLSRVEIAALYRGASAVLLPSDAEGFGLPVVEALACGAAVIASDLPVLREVGGDAVKYAPVGDVDAWVDAVARTIEHPSECPTRELRLAQAGKFTWANHARIIREAYARLK